MGKKETFSEAWAWVVEHGILVWTGQIRNGQRVYKIADEYRKLDGRVMHALFNATHGGEN